jgi:hypothetical protein
MTDGTGFERADLAAALPHVECRPLGTAMILHNRESGAIVASNAFGALLIGHLRAVPDVAAVVHSIADELDTAEAQVREAVAGTLRGWADDGLLLTEQRPFPMPVPHRAPAGITRTLALGAHAVVVHTEDPALLDDIDRALAPMRLARALHPGATPVRLDVILSDAGYGVFRDGAAIWGAAGYELTRFHLLREIMDALCGPDRVAAHLHASAVATGGAGLVFAGASGSGKSTLATLLLGAGAALAADDHVGLATDGGSLLAFPTRPNLKPGARAVAALEPILAAQSEGQSGTGEDFVPRARIPVGEAVGVAAFVFPRYDPDGDNAVEELAPEEALRGLIQTGSRVSRHTRSIAPLCVALNTRPCRALSYRDTDFAISTCCALLES